MPRTCKAERKLTADAAGVVPGQLYRQAAAIVVRLRVYLRDAGKGAGKLQRLGLVSVGVKLDARFAGEELFKILRCVAGDKAAFGDYQHRVAHGLNLGENVA